jgi:hypothetical protein
MHNDLALIKGNEGLGGPGRGPQRRHHTFATTGDGTKLAVAVGIGRLNPDKGTTASFQPGSAAPQAGDFQRRHASRLA